MTKLCADIDRAITEFEVAVGVEIKAIQQQKRAHVLIEIARLEAHIERLRKQHKRTVEPLKELCEWRAKQIQHELAA